MKGKRGKLPRSGDWAQGDKDGEGKGKGSIGVANTNMYQEHAEIPGTSKLLSLICSGLHLHS